MYNEEGKLNVSDGCQKGISNDYLVLNYHIIFKGWNHSGQGEAACRPLITSLSIGICHVTLSTCDLLQKKKTSPADSVLSELCRLYSGIGPVTGYSCMLSNRLRVVVSVYLLFLFTSLPINLSVHIDTYRYVYYIIQFFNSSIYQHYTVYLSLIHIYRYMGFLIKFFLRGELSFRRGPY